MKTIMSTQFRHFRRVPFLALVVASTSGFPTSPANAQGKMLAPDTISTGDVFGFSVTPDGETSFFVRSFGGREKLVLLKAEMQKGHWQKPETAPFSFSDGRFQDIDPVVSPDGKLVLFNSNRPLPGESATGDFNVWVSHKTRTGWGAPSVLSNAINSDSADIYAGMSLAGNVYFGSRRAGGLGSLDLYVSKFKNGNYQVPVNLGPEINSAGSDSNPYIAPDENYLIFASGRPNAKSFMVSFRVDGKWSSPVELPVRSDAAGSMFCPFVDNRSKTFYFARTRVENGKRIENIYYLPLSELKLDSLRARATSLMTYVGKYKIEPATGISTIEIWIKDGKLLGSADGQQTLQLELTSVPDQLLIVENGEKINFVRDDKKQIKSLKINMPDGEVTAVKQPG
jgi:hypothetical protein